MGLLSVFKKGKEQEVKNNPVDFPTTVIESSNIIRDLEQLAKSHNIPVKELDFQVLSYKVFYKKVDSPRYRELQEVDKEKFFQKSNILNTKLEIMQKVKIEVSKRAGLKFPIKIAIGANRDLTQVVATVRKQKQVQYIEGLEEEIIAELDKKKAKQGILLGCFDSEVRSAVKQVVSTIRVNSEVEEDIRFTICEAYEPKKQIIGEIKCRYKEKQDSGDKQIDHSQKGYMHTISEGDILVEVIESKNAVAGRNCKGEIIQFKKIELSNELPEIKVTEDIEVIQDDDSTRYIAKRQGFVYEVAENSFEIRDELVVDAVNFKTTGSISAGGDKDIKINIESNDSMADAIGAGLSVDTSEIKVAGNVANGANVRAKNIEIGGQTHQSSKLYGGDVTAHLHKGFIDGDNVVVNILEGGKIVGDVVRVKKASGGVIEAKEVYIESVLSNVTVRASHHIELDMVEGIGNKFIVDAIAQRGFSDKMENITTSIDDAKMLSTKLMKKVKSIKGKLARDKESIMEVRHHVKSLMMKKVKPPVSLMKKLQNNQDLIKENNLSVKELKDVKISKEVLAEELNDLQSSVFDAKVINHSVWKEYNEVTFKIIEPDTKVTHLFAEGEKVEEMTLKRSTKDGKFKLEKG